MTRRTLLFLIVALCLVKLSIHLAGNVNYGFHRDELLHVSVSEHLASGYMEFPPLIAFIGKFATTLFGNSLSGIRLFATLAGVVILIITCLMAKELGARNTHAIFVAGVAVLSFLPFYRNHTLFQPVAFDQMFWTIGYYCVILFINRRENKYLLLAGVTCGFGLLNKYTFVIWLSSIVIGLAFYDRGSLFKNKYLYGAALIMCVMAMPNIIWQFHHDFPALVHQQKLREVQLEKLDVLSFGLVQLEFPLTLLLSLLGLFGLFFHPALRKFSIVAISVLLIFLVLWLLQAKAYYFFAAYPVLFAAGAAMLEKLIGEKRTWYYVAAAILFLPIIYFVPRLAPVLPIEKFVAYADLKPDEHGRYELTGDYADMFGWTEQVALVDSIYKTFPGQQREKVVIWAENYGEAGAIKVLGDQYGLPDAFSVHGSFWTFGPPKDYVICITVGIEEETIEAVFEEFQLVKVLTHPYAIEEENNIPVYICRKPRIDFRQRWPEFKKYIFS